MPSEERSSKPSPVEPADLDTGTLALFVGLAVIRLVQDRLADAGFGDLRLSHGYVFQYLIEGEPTVGELADRLEMTQQGASKTVAELERLGYTERVPDARDGRARRVRLTSKGREAVEASRAARSAVEEHLTGRLGAHWMADQHEALTRLLDELGGTAAVRSRGVRPPR